MNESLSDAIKEAYALAPSNIAVIETLQISHPSLAESLWLVKNSESLTLGLEDDGGAQLFTACGFRMALPAAGENGLQELGITIDNINRQASDFINSVKNSKDRVSVTYRPYLSSDLTQPQMIPPLQLTLTDVTMNVAEVSGRATFAEVLNKKFPSEYYTRARFPGL